MPPAKGSGKVLLLVAGGAVTLALMVWAAGMLGAGRRLIYFPAGRPPPVAQVLPAANEVTITTADSLDLSAWYLPSGPVAVAVFPGNAGNRAGRVPLAQALGERGLSVLLLDYRGYGGNPGSPSEKGLAADAAAAAAWLSRREEIRRLVYYGESIGAAVAVGLAVEHPPDALVVRSPFTSLADVARLHYGPVPDWLVPDRFASIVAIKQMHSPVLIIAGEDDAIVPMEQSRRLFEAASEPKSFVAIPGAGHNDPELLDGTQMLDAVSDFLRAHQVVEG